MFNDSTLSDSLLAIAASLRCFFSATKDRCGVLLQLNIRSVATLLADSYAHQSW
jgi:hypothetical protein